MDDAYPRSIKGSWSDSWESADDEHVSSLVYLLCSQLREASREQFLRIVISVLLVLDTSVSPLKSLLVTKRRAKKVVYKLPSVRDAPVLGYRENLTNYNIVGCPRIPLVWVYILPCHWGVTKSVREAKHRGARQCFFGLTGQTDTLHRGGKT